MASTAERQTVSDPAAVERQLRIELAAGYRLADKYGMSELINTHISLRIPHEPHTYLMKPDSFLFHEVTASSLVKLDLAGNVISPEGERVNRAGVAIHSSILEARPDVMCVFHSHTPYSTAVSAMECGLLPMTQASLRFEGQLAYHDYGRATDPVECSRLAEDMADKSAMLMRNHGVLTTGETVGQAFVAAFYLEKACQFQVIAQSAQTPLIMVPDKIRAESTINNPNTEERAWAALLRMLDREDPSYKD